MKFLKSSRDLDEHESYPFVIYEEFDDLTTRLEESEYLHIDKKIHPFLADYFKGINNIMKKIENNDCF